MGFIKLPHYKNGQKIALYGGSFNPAHEGHLLVIEHAINQLNIDWVWVLVTPENPFKKGQAYQNYDVRLQKAREVLAHPKVKILDVEKQIGSNYTVEALRFLKKRVIDADLIWLMGADNLKYFHKWKKADEIIHNMPMIIVDRPGATYDLLSSRFTQMRKNYRVQKSQWANLQHGRHSHIKKLNDGKISAFARLKYEPRWIFLTGKRSELRSRDIRFNLGSLFQ